MKSTKNGLIVVGIVAAAGGFYYYKTMTKTAYAKTIAKFTGRDFNDYMGMDKGYLKARANAIKKNAPTFFYGGKTYLTENGTVKQ
jgi:hypothetical protein